MTTPFWLNEPSILLDRNTIFNIWPSKNMSKKTQPKHSNAGKGDKNRITNHKKYADNWEKIFGKKGEKNEKTSNDNRSKRDRN